VCAGSHLYPPPLTLTLTPTLALALTLDDGKLPFHTGFDNAVFMSERDTGFNNYALAHFMRNKHDTTRLYTPPTSVTRVEDDLEFYFQACR